MNFSKNKSDVHSEINRLFLYAEFMSFHNDSEDVAFKNWNGVCGICG